MAFSEATIACLTALGGVCITKAVLQSKLSKMDVAVFDRLWNVFSHPPGSVNLNFSDPFDIPNTNVHFKPLIGIALDKSVVGLRSVSACGWYEAIANELRTTAAISETDLRIGTAFEPFVVERLSRFGKVHHGDYTASGTIGSGQVDVALEGSSSIALFELKKKSLRRIAQTGSTVDVLLDLAGGVIHALGQLNRAELALRTDDHLDLHETGILSRNGRAVKQIVLSWHDYGVFHDHAFLRNFLEKLSGASMTATNTQRQQEINKVRDEFIALARWESQLFGMAGRPEKHHFISTFFYSVGQLLDIPRNCTTADDVIRHLTFNEYVVNSALDVYVEYRAHLPNLLHELGEYGEAH